MPAKLSINQQIVADAFEAQGLDPALGLAIAQQESNFDATATTVTGGDARRGGSYGLCQMSLKTALGLDRQATPARLLNPSYNAKLAALLVRQIQAQAKTKDVSEIASRYNSGRPFHLAPDSTLVYCARVVRFYSSWRQVLAQNQAPTQDSAATGGSPPPSPEPVKSNPPQA